MNYGSVKWALIMTAIAAVGNLLVIFARDGDKVLSERFRDNWREVATNLGFAGLLGAVVGFDGAAK